VSDTRICKRGHITLAKGLCRECKRIRDRESAARKPKPALTEEEKEAKREYARNRYHIKMQNPEYAKEKSKRTWKNYKARIKRDPVQHEKHKARMAERWKKLKADPEKYEREREASNKRTVKWYHKQFDRPDPKAVAEKALRIAQAKAEQEKSGIKRIAYL